MSPYLKSAGIVGIVVVLLSVLQIWSAFQGIVATGSGGLGAVSFGISEFAAPIMARIGFDGPNGFQIQMNASFDPGGGTLPSGISEGSDGRIHRFVVDSTGRRYFGYDLLMVASGPDRLRVRIEPLSLSSVEIAKQQLIDSAFTAVPMTKPPVIPEVKTGDRVVVELIQNPTAGPRVIDSIVFARH
jgi:hypothetical protein